MSGGVDNIKHQLKQAYNLMRSRFGHQHWWPGETDFEICIGAILTQNTAWSNVEKAISNLKKENLLNPRALYQTPSEKIGKLIKPVGYYNIKAKRLKNFLKVLVEEYSGEVGLLLSGNKEEVRIRLLSINGIGFETADSMMLYAGGHLSFVVDAYTKRIFVRHNWANENATYNDLKTLCETSLNDLSPDRLLDYWQDYHAQLVMVGKNYCRKSNPGCESCPLFPLLRNHRPLKNQKI